MAFKMRGNPMQRNFSANSGTPMYKDKEDKKLDKSIKKLEKAEQAFEEGKYKKAKRKASKAVKKVEKAVEAQKKGGRGDDMKFFEKEVKESAGKLT